MLRIELEYPIDNLTKRKYVFWFQSDSKTLWLDEYELLQRASSRHKYQPVEVYYRLPSRECVSSIEKEEIPLTEEIKEDAIRSLVSQIKVEYWSKD